ncbi:hypothetical protein AC578_7655 [Pseudocercospora eumusae]|uniref:Uncharacterized protein n=1 Tax=Pseudocercospora eumusae TaxID=321146 RepID=A0A139H5X2_9PEZI|nr:hypothetical protein AC578_7655 [Pseudocercospora eumusae]
MSHQQPPPAQNEAAMARSCYDAQEKQQRDAPCSQRQFQKFTKNKQPMSVPAQESLEQYSERQQQRNTLRMAAQKSGKEADRALTILKWGGNIQSTLSVIPTERPFQGTNIAMLDHTWPNSFTKESRVERASRPREPLEPEYGEGCDPNKGKMDQEATVNMEEFFDFGRYYEDEADTVKVSQATEEERFNGV